MDNFTLDSVLQRIDIDVVETDFDGDVVLMHIDHGKYYSLNATSSDLWRWLATPTKIQNLVTQLHEKYNCSQEQSFQDILLFLDQLVDLKLVHVVY